MPEYLFINKIYGVGEGQSMAHELVWTDVNQKYDLSFANSIPL